MKTIEIEEHVLALRRAIVALLDVADLQMRDDLNWKLIQPTLQTVADLQVMIDALNEK